MRDDFLEKPGDLILIAGWVFGGLVAFLIFGWQIFNWLRTSIWIPIPIHEAITYLGFNLTSIYRADDWIGLAKVAQWLLDAPLAIGAPAILIAAAHLFRSLAEAVNIRIRLTSRVIPRAWQMLVGPSNFGESLSIRRRVDGFVALLVCLVWALLVVWIVLIFATAIYSDLAQIGHEPIEQMCRASPDQSGWAAWQPVGEAVPLGRGSSGTQGASPAPPRQGGVSWSWM